MTKCNSLHCGPGRRAAVYRLYDRTQRLLYVGIAHDTQKRWQQHARDKDWWSQVHWRTAVWHTSRLGAAIEEYCAIRYENPIHNKNRDYDYRLGWEPSDTPGPHKPRPWRLRLLASAMTYPNGGISWDDAAPHYAAVRSADQGGVDADCVRIWFPQIPELGYWTCGPLAAPDSRAELHGLAADILTQDYGLDAGSFTLSIHESDGCLEPELKSWAGPGEPEPLPWRNRIRARVNGLKVAVAVMEVCLRIQMGFGVVAACNLLNLADLSTYGQHDVLSAAFAGGALSGLATRAMLRSLRSI